LNTLYVESGKNTYISFILQYLFHHSLKHNRFAVVNNGNQVLSMSN
jgi:hypothetical protein